MAGGAAGALFVSGARGSPTQWYARPDRAGSDAPGSQLARGEVVDQLDAETRAALEALGYVR